MNTFVATFRKSFCTECRQDGDFKTKTEIEQHELASNITPSCRLNDRLQTFSMKRFSNYWRHTPQVGLFNPLKAASFLEDTGEHHDKSIILEELSIQLT